MEHTGFKARPFRTEGTYSKYNSIDDKIDDLHYHTTWVKFGLGRASHDTSQEIRNGHLTREEGVALVRRFDGEFPDRYLGEVVDYLEIEPDRLGAVRRSAFARPLATTGRRVEASPSGVGSGGRLRDLSAHCIAPLGTIREAMARNQQVDYRSMLDYHRQYGSEPSVSRAVPQGQHFDMTDLSERLLAGGRSLVSFPVSEYWLDIGQPEDYEQALRDAAEGTLPS